MAFRRRFSIEAVFRTINPNYLSFLAGIVVSAAINVYTNMLWANKTNQSAGVVMSSILLVASAIFITSVSIHLQSIRDDIAQTPTFLTSEEREAIHLQMILQLRTRLIVLTVFALATALAGFFFLQSSLESTGYSVDASPFLSPLR